MKRRRRSRSVLSVSLFPFLAVLICTLGVLIVMLVLAVKAAESQAAVAQANADDGLNSRLKAKQLQLEEKQIQIDGLQEVRPEALKRLEDARATRSHFEDEVRQLQAEARALGETVLAFENQRLGIQTDAITDEELSDLEEAIEDAKKELQQKRVEAEHVPEVTWSIVPYKGKNGTNRRPIFVECLADRVVLQPLNVEINQKELRAAVFPGNMLDAALLAIREYWQRYDLDGDAGRAYPLIVVRPDGARTFQVARSSLKAWDDEYGYELVDSKKKINFGQFDAQLAEEVKSAIADSRERQIRLAEVAALREKRAARQKTSRKHGGDQRPGLTVSRTGGGFVLNGAKSASMLDREPAGGREPHASQTQSADDHSYVAHHAAGDAKAAVLDDDSYDIRDPSEIELDSQNEYGSASQRGDASNADGSSSVASTSLADSRGANWALPSRSEGAVPYVRPIRVICYPDHLIVKGGDEDSLVSMNGATQRAVDELVNEIWARIESWGVAGQNSYWKPELRISVMEGSESRFNELRILLADSGILVEGA